MLRTLTIHNFGLIDDMTIEFGPGLNILSGSTGAGKSIIIDGLRFALGERLNPSLVRDPARPCDVEAVFDLSARFLGAHPDYREWIDPDDPVLILTRTYLPDAKTRVKMNGRTATLTQLKTIGDDLVDLHGPHDHQLLLREELHREILDQLIDFAHAMPAYTDAFTKYTELREELTALEDLARSRERDLDLLTYQLRELEQVPLSEADYDALCSQQRRLTNAERLREYASGIRSCFDDDERGLNEQLRQAVGLAQRLSALDTGAQGILSAMMTLQDTAEDLSRQIHDYLEVLAIDPADLETINRKYDVYDTIRRKYGPTIDDARVFYQEAKQKHETLLNLDHNTSELKNQTDTALRQVHEQAAVLTRLREKTAKRLKKTIESELADLGFDHVEFETRFETIPPEPSGTDHVRFFISPNAGEDLKPLADIVSSGEAARIMLALKRALINADPVPVLVFDEIDAQIGGRLGTVTGEKLKSLARDRQVLLITHLPQIAAFGQTHLKISKQIIKGRTITRVDPLDADGRVNELAQMLAGADTTKLAQDHARTMLKAAQSTP